LLPQFYFDVVVEIVWMVRAESSKGVFEDSHALRKASERTTRESKFFVARELTNP
jgi:hypothetical protein